MIHIRCSYSVPMKCFLLPPTHHILPPCCMLTFRLPRSCDNCWSSPFLLCSTAYCLWSLLLHLCLFHCFVTQLPLTTCQGNSNEWYILEAVAVSQWNVFFLFCLPTTSFHHTVCWQAAFRITVMIVGHLPVCCLVMSTARGPSFSIFAFSASL